MEGGSEVIVKKFPTRTEALGFAASLLLDVEAILIRHEGESWNVSYNAERSVVYLGDHNFSRVE